MVGYGQKIAAGLSKAKNVMIGELKDTALSMGAATKALGEVKQVEAELKRNLTQGEKDLLGERSAYGIVRNIENDLIDIENRLKQINGCIKASEKLKITEISLGRKREELQKIERRDASGFGAAVRNPNMVMKIEKEIKEINEQMRKDETAVYKYNQIIQGDDRRIANDLNDVGVKIRYLENVMLEVRNRKIAQVKEGTSMEKWLNQVRPQIQQLQNELHKLTSENRNVQVLTGGTKPF